MKLFSIWKKKTSCINWVNAEFDTETYANVVHVKSSNWQYIINMTWALSAFHL